MSEFDNSHLSDSDLLQHAAASTAHWRENRLRLRASYAEVLSRGLPNLPALDEDVLLEGFPPTGSSREIGVAIDQRSWEDLQFLRVLLGAKSGVLNAGKVVELGIEALMNEQRRSTMPPPEA